jgi:hypothetical protein
MRETIPQAGHFPTTLQLACLNAEVLNILRLHLGRHG